MDNKTMAQFKNLFLGLKKEEELLDLADQLERTQSGDDADKSLADRENHIQLKLKGRNRHYLMKIEEALTKIEKGTFGECEDCGAQIPLSRLYARPTACLCINCKEEQEGEERHIRYDKRSHTHGQELIA